MTRWTLNLKRPVDFAVDASSISVANFAGRSKSEIESMEIQSTRLGELFEVDVCDGEGQMRIVIVGDLRSFHRIGTTHTDGEIWIDGNAGDFLGAAMGGRRVGMTGGRIVVTGDAGDYAAHRMRRGEIWIGGNVGRLAAANMVAGTLAVAGKVPTGNCVGMRRGSFLVSALPELPDGRFTRAIGTTYLMAPLVSPPKTDRFETFWERFCHAPVVSRRGDRAVAGQGEVVAPAAD